VLYKAQDNRDSEIAVKYTELDTIDPIVDEFNNAWRIAMTTTSSPMLATLK